MALIKTGQELEQVTFKFDGAGDVNGVDLTYVYNIIDNVTNKTATRLRDNADVWEQLTAGQKTQAKAIGKRLKDITEAL